MNGVLGHFYDTVKAELGLGTTWANEMNLG